MPVIEIIENTENAPAATGCYNIGEECLGLQQVRARHKVRKET
jgi:hypothetical protein